MGQLIVNKPMIVHRRNAKNLLEGIVEIRHVLEATSSIVISGFVSNRKRI